MKSKEEYTEGKSSSSVFRDTHIKDFLVGFNSAEKETKKQIKDLKNKYGSWLVEAQTRKLTKIVDQEEVLKLKAKLEVLTELEKKLKL